MTSRWNRDETPQDNNWLRELFHLRKWKASIADVLGGKFISSLSTLSLGSCVNWHSQRLPYKIIRSLEIHKQTFIGIEDVSKWNFLARSVNSINASSRTTKEQNFERHFVCVLECKFDSRHFSLISIWWAGFCFLPFIRKSRKFLEPSWKRLRLTSDMTLRCLLSKPILKW